MAAGDLPEARQPPELEHGVRRGRRGRRPRQQRSGRPAGQQRGRRQRRRVRQPGGGPGLGGISALSLLFTRTVTDHGDFPDSEGAGRDEDINLWPFVLWGSGDSEEDDYLAIAPFGGTTRGLLGKEKITWFGYPYPIYAAVTDRSYTSHHVLFPLINWIDGPHNSGFRIFPLFGHYERTTLKGDPVYEKTWLLWPLLSWATTGMNEEEPTHSFFLFPFYGHILGPSVTSYGPLAVLQVRGAARVVPDPAGQLEHRRRRRGRPHR